MYTIDASKDGAQEYYNSIVNLYASWGVDFIKCDDLSRPYHKKEIEMLRKAIDNCGRPILLSMSPGETPIAEGEHARDNANMWRTIDDFWDNWKELKMHFDIFRRWNKFRAPGAYPDGDMLPIGHLGIKAERGVDRQSLFTQDEQYTLMTLFAIFKSPLMYGGDLPTSNAFALSLITNKEVLYLLNHSIDNKELYYDNDKVIWTAKDPESKAVYLALFNISETKQTVSLSLKEQLGISGKYKLINLWTGKKKDSGDEKLSEEINPHGAVLFKLMK